ncbi:hypothetical protein LIER_16270 [Lithospermum erythrorhizon]|uniref:Uncharacterized protein n=1 Tax=Lithospermum erythrorhizon TaxID=34254 RepID=A0AAV3Q982_LITER
MMGEIGTMCYNWWNENNYSQNVGENYYRSWYGFGSLKCRKLILVGNLVLKKATKGKKEVENADDDARKVVEPQIVEEKAQKLKWHKKSRKGKGEGSKALASTKKEGMILRCLTLLLLGNLYNPMTEVDNRDADVGGDKSMSEIPTKENVADKTITPIVEEGVEDYSCVEGVTNLLEYPAVPSNTDLMGGSVNVSSVDDTMTDADKQPSDENVSEAVDPSAKDIVDGLNENAPIGEKRVDQL